ncbi:MAG: hypothetical protein AAGI53_04950 [Planctomycetota bacterium]
MRALALLIIAVLTLEAFGQAGVTRPRAASRLVRVFDFEERRTNPTTLPRHWVRAQNDPEVRTRPGFPLWNQGRLVYGPGAASGEGAVKLETRGGSASLLLDPGVVSVFPEADYLVSVMVRTEGVSLARPQLVARLLDGSGNRIEGSERSSRLIRRADRWTPLAVELPGDDDRAAFVQVELLLLQPEQYERMDLPDLLHVQRQDLTGAAWFDDVRVIQLPRVEVWSRVEGNVIYSEERPDFNYLVRDLTGEPLAIRLIAFDDRGVVVDEHRIESKGGVETGVWTPDFPSLGWYRVIARVETGDGTIDQAFADAIWIPSVSTIPSRPEASRSAFAGMPYMNAVDLESITDRRRFGVGLTEVPDAASPELARAIASVQPGFASVAIWDKTTLGETMAQRVNALAPAIDRLTTSIPLVELAFERIPDDVRIEAGLDSGDVIGLLAGEPMVYSDALRRPLDRFGGGVARWRLGPGGSDRAFDRATLGDDLRTIESVVSRLVPTPILGIPWRADRALSEDATAPARLVSIRGFPSDGADGVVHAARRWANAVGDPDGSFTPPGLRLEFPGTVHNDHPVVGRRGRVVEFARAITMLWAELSVAEFAALDWGVSLADAWSWTPGRRGELAPSPELAAMRVAADRLAGRTFVGEPVLIKGVRTLLFEGPRGAMLAMWRSGEGPDTMRARLGISDVIAYDVYGNPTPIELRFDETETVLEHEITLGNEPMFVEGIDADLIRFLSGVRLDPPLLEARVGERQHDIVIDNPWSGSVRGRMFILEPGGGLLEGDAMLRARRSWKIAPRQRSFVVSGRSEYRGPVGITFSPAEESGPRDLIIDVELSAEEDYGLVRLVRPIEIGLTEADLAVSYRRGPGPGGPDLVIEAQVTNSADTSISVELFARAPGYPRERAIIAELGPGESATRVFPYLDAIDKVNGQRIHVAAVIEETGGRLTRSMKVIAD